MGSAFFPRGLCTLLLVTTCAADSIPDEERWPLIFAAGEGDAVAVKSLLAGGADVHER